MVRGRGVLSRVRSILPPRHMRIFELGISLDLDVRLDFTSWEVKGRVWGVFFVVVAGRGKGYVFSDVVGREIRGEKCFGLYIKFSRRETGGSRYL